jgi:hypothetical protein
MITNAYGIENPNMIQNVYAPQDAMTHNSYAPEESYMAQTNYHYYTNKEWPPPQFQIDLTFVQPASIIRSLGLMQNLTNAHNC